MNEKLTNKKYINIYNIIIINMSIITKRGDFGYTSLYNGDRMPKNHPRIKALGEIQHLTYMISQYISVTKKENTTIKNAKTQLKIIMHWLYELSAYIATPRDNSTPDKIEQTRFTPDKENDLTKMIHKLEDILPKQTCLLLPMGNKYSCGLYILSSQTRKVERKIYTAIKDNKTEMKDVLPFINRLSDYFYILARSVNKLYKIKEIPYKKNVRMQ